MIGVSPVDRLKIDPVTSVKAQAWYDRLAARQQKNWLKKRAVMVAAAQRAEVARHTVIG